MEQNDDRAGLPQAIDEALALAARRPQPGTPEHGRLDTLLAALSARDEAASEGADIQSRLEALRDHLEDFRRRRDEGRIEPGAEGEGAGGFTFPG
jgi:hypothetical protein